MKNQKSMGLDELMIINPGLPEAAGPGSAELFLGEDGRLYEIQGIESEAGLAAFFLGDDGSLYQLHGAQSMTTVGPGERRLPRFFLGEDGTLYQMMNR
jgi:hypothetical protein